MLALYVKLCRTNMLHTLSSTAMRTDALTQSLVKKRWDRLARVFGSHPEDQALAEAMRRAPTKLEWNTRNENRSPIDTDIRRSASAELPLCTQHETYIVPRLCGMILQFNGM